MPADKTADRLNTFRDPNIGGNRSLFYFSDTAFEFERGWEEGLQNRMFASGTSIDYRKYDLLQMIAHQSLPTQPFKEGKGVVEEGARASSIFTIIDPYIMLDVFNPEHSLSVCVRFLGCFYSKAQDEGGTRGGGRYRRRLRKWDGRERSESFLMMKKERV
ncbi:hypothetical protein CEXT_244491 [Caerostris extrusa]|uniref:Uncharacterized protein n=1 Tax=Caerostris extrusa TaxID=172846 RepID=A0AAV4VLB7_CAEEX|nr:hypothetical protein CEXT_244491 [Caerostris extrusa]